MGRRSTAIAPVAASDFTALIAERAYFKAEQRGFAPGKYHMGNADPVQSADHPQPLVFGQ